MNDSKTKISPHEGKEIPSNSSEDVDLGFSMRMSENQPEHIPDMFPIRPDTKGPKSVGILLIFGAIFLFFQAYGDVSLHQAEDLSTAEVEMLLVTPNSQGDGSDNVSVEQYQEYLRSTCWGCQAMFRTPATSAATANTAGLLDSATTTVLLLLLQYYCYY